MHYRRTYYQYQNTGEYQHLLPEELGFRKRRRIDPVLDQNSMSLKLGTG
ncbi:UPF0236 family transposase-like protein [Thermatribacter velox]